MLLDFDRRAAAIRRQARRDYWLGMATITGLALMQVPFFVVAWRLFWVP